MKQFYAWVRLSCYFHTSLFKGGSTADEVESLVMRCTSTGGGGGNLKERKGEVSGREYYPHNRDLPL